MTTIKTEELRAQLHLCGTSKEPIIGMSKPFDVKSRENISSFEVVLIGREQNLVTQNFHTLKHT